MDKGLNKLGWLFTGTYLLCAAVYTVLCWDKFLILKPNELGDFLAGSFSPLAFFWLVLGFFQQGRELKISSDALVLQAKELTASVQHQGELVDVAKKQYATDVQRIAKEEELAAKAILPQIKITATPVEQALDGVMYLLTFKNIGYLAEDFRVAVQTTDGYEQLLFTPALGSDAVSETRYLFRENLDSIIFEMEYTDGGGIRHQSKLRGLLIKNPNRLPDLELLR